MGRADPPGDRLPGDVLHCPHELTREKAQVQSVDKTDFKGKQPESVPKNIAALIETKLKEAITQTPYMQVSSTHGVDETRDNGCNIPVPAVKVMEREGEDGSLGQHSVDVVLLPALGKGGDESLGQPSGGATLVPTGMVGEEGSVHGNPLNQTKKTGMVVAASTLGEEDQTGERSLDQTKAASGVAAERFGYMDLEAAEVTKDKGAVITWDSDMTGKTLSGGSKNNVGDGCGINLEMGSSQLVAGCMDELVGTNSGQKEQHPEGSDTIPNPFS